MLTAAEVACELKISKSLVYELHASGALPGYRFGPKTLRFDQADVDAYAAASAPKLIPAPVLREYDRLRLRVPQAHRGQMPRLSAEQQAIVDRRVRRMRMPPWANGKAIRALYDKARQLTAETGVVHHVDHVIPLQGDFVTGLHVETNMQILRFDDNLAKSNHFEIE